MSSDTCAVGYYVFLSAFCYSQAYDLWYCTGFESRERVYRNYPEALLHWKVALEVVSSMLSVGAYSICSYMCMYTYIWMCNLHPWYNDLCYII